MNDFSFTHTSLDRPFAVTRYRELAGHNLTITMNATLKCFFLEVYWKQIGRDATASKLSCAVTALFALTAILGNGILMLVICRTRELHSPSFVLLFCLAASDLLVGLVGQPSFFAYKLAELLENFSAYCKLRMVQFFSGWITSSVSLVTLNRSLPRSTSRFNPASTVQQSDHSATGSNGYNRSLDRLFCWDHHQVLV